jgi:hypothetical protein
MQIPTRDDVDAEGLEEAIVNVEDLHLPLALLFSLWSNGAPMSALI